MHMRQDMGPRGPVWPRPDTRLNVSRRRSPTAQYTRASALYLYVRVSIMHPRAEAGEARG